MPPGWFTLDCCPCDEGSGSGDPIPYFEVTCLDSVCAGTGTQFTCPTSTLPNNWCVTDFGSTNASSRCAYLFDTMNLNVLGDLCTGVCSWGIQSFNDPNVTVGNCPGGYQIILGLVCEGDNPLGVTGAEAPDNGIILYAVINNADSSLAEAVWFIAADDFDCNGSNVLVLLATENSADENWAASIEIHPCARGAGFPPGFCE